jgi:hypothetical protein
LEKNFAGVNARALMERQPPAGIMDRGRHGHATPKLILFQM